MFLTEENLSIALEATPPYLKDRGIPTCIIGDVANCKRVIESYTQTYSEIGLAQSKMWNAGTLCITIAANIAKAGVLGFDACFPDSIVRFQPNKKTTNEYILINTRLVTIPVARFGGSRTSICPKEIQLGNPRQKSLD